MTIFQAFFLAIVQGLTEFLPVSSSGHLVLFQKIFQMGKPPIVFDVLLHLGTLTAVFIFFRKEIYSLVKNWRLRKNVWLFLIIGTIPAAVFGYFLNSRIGEVFNSLRLLSFSWIFFGLLLLISYYFKFKKSHLDKRTDSASWKDGLIVGLFQAIALFPGVSRSGMTMIGSFWRGFNKNSSFELSFFLSIPAILGAAVLELKDGHFNGISLPIKFMGILVAGIVGYLSLIILQKVLKSDKFYYFGFYCLALGILVAILG